MGLGRPTRRNTGVLHGGCRGDRATKVRVRDRLWLSLAGPGLGARGDGLREPDRLCLSLAGARKVHVEGRTPCAGPPRRLRGAVGQASGYPYPHGLSGGTRGNCHTQCHATSVRADAYINFYRIAEFYELLNFEQVIVF